MSLAHVNGWLAALLAILLLSHLVLLFWGLLELLKLRRLSQAFIADSDRLRHQLLAMQADNHTAPCNPTNWTNPKA